jgi:asparagine synthetase B (glutamine-hydrolysing)
MTLPPLYNVCAAYEPDLQERARLQRRLSDSGFFQQVHCSLHGWLLGVTPVGTETATWMAADSVFCERSHAQGSLAELLHAGDHAPDTLGQYPGDFTFVHLPADGSIVLVRSCAGRVPLYYAQHCNAGATRILVGSRLDYFAAFSQQPVQVDGLATALALNGYGVAPDGRTPLAGVHCLPSAHQLRLGASHTAQPQRYWTPRRELQRPTAASKERHAARLHTLLCETLRNELHVTTGNLLWCSGGVDSSALAALSVGRLGKPLWLQSFTAPDEASARYDDTFLLSLQERYRFSKVWRATNTPEHCLQLARQTPKTCYPVCYFPLSDLSQLTREAPIKVVFGGEFADEGTGSPRNIGDWLDHTTLHDLLDPMALPNGPRTLRQWLSWHAKRRVGRQWLRLPDRLGPMFQRTIEHEYRDWSSEQRRRFAADHEPLRTLWLRTQHDAWRAEWWEAASPLGVRPLAPFYTREHLELYFDCHPLEWFDGQRAKALLRRALRGHMPDWHRERPDKGNWPGFLHDVQLPIERPPELPHDLLDPSWLAATFKQNSTAQLPAPDALQLTWLTNMLSAIARLADAPSHANHRLPDVGSHRQAPRVASSAIGS